MLSGTCLGETLHTLSTNQEGMDEEVESSSGTGEDVDPADKTLTLLMKTLAPLTKTLTLPTKTLTLPTKMLTLPTKMLTLPTKTLTLPMNALAQTMKVITTTTCVALSKDHLFLVRLPYVPRKVCMSQLSSGPC